MTKKASTDPTFPAPPANAPNTGGAATDESIDAMLEDLGKPPEPGKKKRRAVPEPSEAVAAEPHAPAPRAEHETIPNANVIVREPTEPGLGNELKVTPEERARLDAMMKAHARVHAEREEQQFLAPGDRNAETSPGRVINKPPPVTTDAGKTIPRKPMWPAAVGVLLIAAVVIAVVMHSSSKSSSSSAAATTTATTTATTPATTTATAPATTTEVAPLPTIATTNVESLPTATSSPTAHPVATSRPVPSATTASSARPSATAASPTSTQPPPPGMHLLPDDPHK